MNAIVRYASNERNQPTRIRRDETGDWPLEVLYSLADVIEDAISVVVTNSDGSTVVYYPDWTA